MSSASLIRHTVSGLAFALLTGPLIAYDPIEEVPADFKMPKPLTLEESLASFVTKPGLRIELVAAEPMVMDPINIDWGPDGKLWVVEMTDYPLGIDEKGTPGGRVRFLQDTTGDGKYDRSTLFLDGLNFPTGVKWWKNGVLVVAAPEIFYAEDTNGDGKADKREVLYRGFKEGNQQHRVNGLVWGGDGWLHLANGDSAGTVESVKTGKKLELGSFDLRIKPETGEMELTSGRTQYGRAKDDHGNWFGCNNSRPLFHYVLPDEYLRRNPHVIYPKSSIDLTPTAPKVFPIGDPAHRYNNAYSLGYITSACGLTIYRDDRLGEGFRGNAFVCEPVHNLVHRMVLEPDGVTFKARRADDEQESEFLASSDTWFRPTAALTGPDGGLWVVDMHRYVIEHPEWIPKPWQKVLDLRAGHDRGRIYRVVSDDCAKSTVPLLLDQNPPPLGSKYSPEMVQNLSNGRFHDSYLQFYRIHSLSLNPPERPIAATLNRLESDLPGTLDSFSLRVAFSLGNNNSEQAGKILAKLALDFSSDPYFVAGAMSSLVPHVATVAKAASAALREKRTPLLPYLFETSVALKKTDALASLLNGPNYQLADRFEAYSGLLIVLDRRRISLELFREDHPALASALDSLDQLSVEARKRAVDPKTKLEDRLAAFSFLGRTESARKADQEILLSSLSTQNSIEIQRAAIRRLAEMSMVDPLFALWSQTTPAVHQAIVMECLSKGNLTEKLLAALESDAISNQSIDAASRDRLLRYSNSKIRDRAKAVFGADSNEDRKAVVEEYAVALKLEGNHDRGLLVFQTACAICHQLAGVGREIGANLTALADRTGPSLLTAILDPNSAVEDKFLLYEVKLDGGETLAGMIAGESGDSLTLQLLDGAERQVLRGQVTSIASTGRSAMPEGLEAALTPQQIADLIAFIQGADRLNP